jgi:outer membrane protein
MRKFKMAFVGITLVLLSGALPSYGADVAKIGVINFQKILEISSAGKAADAEIKKQGKKMETELRQKQTELQKLNDKLEREALVMSREMREEKQRELRISINDLKLLEKKYNKEMKILNQKLGKRIQDEVFKMVGEFGKKEGFLLIVEKMAGGVVYSPQTIDITDQIIQLYNENFAQKSSNLEGER